MEARFAPSIGLAGSLTVPGDKSISHRAAIIGALADGTTTVRGYSQAADCSNTLDVLRAVGVRVEVGDGAISIIGRGVGGFEAPVGPLHCGNSGTTMRLVAGALATSPNAAVLTGDDSLNKRPMRRVIEPLTMMGVKCQASDEAGHPPLTVRGGRLDAITYAPPVASAQVKSAVLLAGLGARGVTTVRELVPTRDHTERMLRLAGIQVSSAGPVVSVTPGVPCAFDLRVPGDFSSAAFFITAALMVPGSAVTVTGVGLNPTRTEFLRLLERMGARLEVTENEGDAAHEPSGDIRAESGPLEAIDVSADEVALSIDEVTLLALLATSARGTTTIRGARELRNKESDRISGTVAGLSAMGAKIEETTSGMVIEGPVELQGARVGSRGDHRIAMMLGVAGLAACGETIVEGWEWTQISYPGFGEALSRLRKASP